MRKIIFILELIVINLNCFGNNNKVKLFQMCYSLTNNNIVKLFQMCYSLYWQTNTIVLFIWNFQTSSKQSQRTTKKFMKTVENLVNLSTPEFLTTYH